MAEVILMPKLSDTMEEGVVAEWHKKVGDTVKSGELIAEIETDKATMEFESFYDGKLLYIGVQKGDAAPVNNVLAIIGEDGEDVEKLVKEAEAKHNQGEAETATEEPASVQKEESVSVVESKPAVVSQPSQPVTTTVSTNDSDKIFASPLARKMAQERNIDLNTVIGTGENGRIVKRDIEHYVPYERPAGMPSIGNVGGALQESYTDENVSQMRKVIAKRLGESKFSAPHFYLTMEIDMDNAMAARKAVNANDGIRISFNDMVIKAVAMSLRKHPAVNSSWMGDTIRRNQHIHIGVAVAVDEGLLVPVVRFADSKGMMQIGAEVKDYAERARDKKLQPNEWEGNTFTISNLGMFGIEEFTAIINPPDSCILAVGAIKQTPVVKNGQIVPGNVMKVTLSCDHRVVDGATGSEFLKTFKQYMENPVMMLV